MNDRVFNIDFKTLAIQWLPTFYRGPIITTFTVMIIMPLLSLYIQFLKQRKQNLIKMTVTGQKFSLQKRLNDLFDPLQRRIRIVKAVQFESVYLYTEAEDDVYHSKTKWIFGDGNPIYLRTDAELNSEFDFIVEIPNTSINQYHLRAEIEYYMLQSKNYNISII